MAWVVLAVGTTVGVATLVATPLIPVARLRLRLRPGLRFPAGIGARVRGLAAAGVAVPIATSAFPELSARSASFDATSATSTRAIMVASWLGVAGMAGTCIPLARGFQSHVGQAAGARQPTIPP